MLRSLRHTEKNKGTYRQRGVGRRVRYMTPDLSYWEGAREQCEDDKSQETVGGGNFFLFFFAVGRPGVTRASVSPGPSRC